MSSFFVDEGAQLWQQRFEMLRQWKQKYGHCAVPKAAGLLGRWTSRQRELAKKGRLCEERLHALVSLGFVWDANETAWQTRFNELVEYYNKHGHTYVPSAYPGLGIWVAKLRGKYRRGKLSESKVTQLRTLNFVWSPSDAEWMDKFEVLRSFRKKHGHCIVPFKDTELEKLGWWCNTQRQNYRKGKLSAERIRLLTEIGFVWKPQELASVLPPYNTADASARNLPNPNAPKRMRSDVDGDSTLVVSPRTPKRQRTPSSSSEPSCSDVSRENMPINQVYVEKAVDLMVKTSLGRGIPIQPCSPREGPQTTRVQPQDPTTSKCFFSELLPLPFRLPTELYRRQTRLTSRTEGGASLPGIGTLIAIVADRERSSGR